jgi:hypothetical protein
MDRSGTANAALELKPSALLEMRPSDSQVVVDQQMRVKHVQRRQRLDPPRDDF